MAEPILINGLPEGVLVLLLDAQTLSGFLEISSASGLLSVIDTNNHVLFSEPGQTYFKRGDIYSEEELEEWLISKKPLYGSSNLFVVFKQKSKIAFQAVTDVQYALIVFITLSLLGIFFSLSISAEIVTKALASISNQMQTLRTDTDLSKRIEISAIKELADMEVAYNEMAQSLERTTVSKDYIDALFDGLPLPVFVTDINGRITRTNRPAALLYVGQVGIFPSHFQDLIAERDLNEHKKSLEKDFGYLAKNDADAFFYIPSQFEFHETEMRLKTHRSEETSYILSTSSISDQNKNVIGYIISATDISDRKQQEKEILELAEQNTLMARAIEEIDLGVTISDGRQPHQPLIFCNKAFLDLSGRNMEEIVGFSCSFMQGPETDPKATKLLSEAIRNQKPVRVEILNYRKNGQSFWNELSLNPIFANDGNLKYYVGIQNDISERKRVEAMKKEFVSTVSHELRTPLTAIHGSLGLLSDIHDVEQNSEEQELLSMAYRNSERLKYLVDDILDTEKLEAGEMRFYPENY